MPFVIHVQDADIMLTLLVLKTEVENKLGSKMKMVFEGASEAHLIAKELGGWKHTFRAAPSEH